ncbi:DUF4189 domain-containing protein [Agrobacterium tumefaciens]|uniref:DUF4189 domain-containing protein n=1 Tax=Agrobacterium tumefaciens TaxID=358 RepID=UPI0022442262|nr:DUF4189 domain-containing protein [Agrobacterium tumefaciens]MCW8060431.1 DUF4189 domain-containing protein [Agrobacterium tumefaciens]MCW8145875.1 DUF4189 domain-containing protein [Agrobacterium tumefaciens]
MTIRNILAAVGLFAVAGISTVSAADLPATTSEIPEPPVVQLESGSNDQKGIWAAIAYSERDGRHGFFWGADKRPEAEQAAVQHCERAGGASCTIVSVFRNHRHWNDDDGSGFPYNHCGALAVSTDPAGGMSAWGAKSASTRKEAEDLSLSACEASGRQCDIREWVCT